MNFKIIPELDWDFGYAYALGVMTTIAAVLTCLFKRVDGL